jgi:hypothetical protein
VKPVSTSTRNCFDRTIIKYFCGRESEGYSHATLKFPCMWLVERWLGSWEVSYGDSAGRSHNWASQYPLEKGLWDIHRLLLFCRYHVRLSGAYFGLISTWLHCEGWFDMGFNRSVNIKSRSLYANLSCFPFILTSNRTSW